MAFFTNLGFRLKQIFPADDPSVAVMSGHGIYIRIDKSADCESPILFLMTDDMSEIANGEKEIIAPNGTKIKVVEKASRLKFQKLSINSKSENYEMETLGLLEEQECYTEI